MVAGAPSAAKSSAVSLKKVKPKPPGIEHVVASIDVGGEKIAVAVDVDCTGQHTITWHDHIDLPVSINGRAAMLPQGSCNFYKYPRVFFGHLRKGKAVVPPLEQLFVLEELVRALLLGDVNCCITQMRDGAGATPLHGLIVANTKASLSLTLHAYRQRPSLLTQSHTGKVFTGENALHILCVNRREAELCQCIEIAAEQLKPSQLQAIFWKQATGVFFAEDPMAYYGGTPVSYAVAFSLQNALKTMLRCSKDHKAMRGVIDFNDPAKAACKLTGLLPLHVAVANSLTNMFNFLVDLPGLTIEYDDMRALPDVRSRYAARTSLSGMLPLQVATKLGDKKLVQYILRTQSKQQWVWGPVTSYNLDLEGIDSAGVTGNDVMEICARLDALEATQEMLLDTFMAGLLHELFLQKFEQRGLQWLHYTMRLIDIVYLIALYTFAGWLRTAPEAVLAPQSTIDLALPYVILIAIGPLLFEDLRVSVAWWQVARSVGPTDMRLVSEGGSTGSTPLHSDIWMLICWMQSHNMWVKFVGWTMASACSLLLLEYRSWPADDVRWDASLVTARDRTDILLVPLSLASFLHGLAFFSALLFQFPGLGIFYKVCFQMLASDVKNWVILFSIFLCNYGGVMYISYPRFSLDPKSEANLTMVPVETLVTMASYDEPVPVFAGSPISALQSLIELGIIGERVEIDLLSGFQHDAIDGSARGSTKLALFILFACFYSVYVVMSLILLLNLLIAMMGDTYTSSLESATRMFRVNFARRVLRLELQAGILARCGLIMLHCGERAGDVWVYNYRNYQANAEGGGTRGAKASMFEDDVERDADEDEEDDDGPGGGDDDLVVNREAIAIASSPRGAGGAAGGNAHAARKWKMAGRATVLIAPRRRVEDDLAADDVEVDEGDEI